MGRGMKRQVVKREKEEGMEEETQERGKGRTVNGRGGRSYNTALSLVDCRYTLPPWHGLYGYQSWQLFCCGHQFRLSSYPVASSNQWQCHLQEREKDRERGRRVSHSPDSHYVCAIKTLLAIFHSLLPSPSSPSVPFSTPPPLSFPLFPFQLFSTSP